MVCFNSGRNCLKWFSSWLSMKLCLVKLRIWRNIIRKYLNFWNVNKCWKGKLLFMCKRFLSLIKYLMVLWLKICLINGFELWLNGRNYRFVWMWLKIVKESLRRFMESLYYGGFNWLRLKGRYNWWKMFIWKICIVIIKWCCICKIFWWLLIWKY